MKAIFVLNCINDTERVIDAVISGGFMERRRGQLRPSAGSCATVRPSTLQLALTLTTLDPQQSDIHAQSGNESPFEHLLDNTGETVWSANPSE